MKKNMLKFAPLGILLLRTLSSLLKHEKVNVTLTQPHKVSLLCSVQAEEIYKRLNDYISLSLLHLEL